MAEVVPAILENTLQEIKQRVDQVKPHVKEFHLDIMDGEFVPNTTFNDPAALAETKLGLKYWPHLMISHPELHLKKWDLDEVEGIIVHKEAVNNIEEAIRLIKDIDKRVGVAINPKTATFDIKENLDDIDLVLIMGVEPGFAAQAFDADVLDKIKYLKEIKPDLPIAVDGGVNGATKDKILAAGADILSANSYIFKSSDIKEAINSLKN